MTLRTARVIVGNLDRHDVVTKMLRSIVGTERADYDTLINTTYTDDNDAGDARHAAAASRIDENNRVSQMDN